MTEDCEALLVASGTEKNMKCDCSCYICVDDADLLVASSRVKVHIVEKSSIAMPIATDQAL